MIAKSNLNWYEDSVKKIIQKYDESLNITK